MDPPNDFEKDAKAPDGEVRNSDVASNDSEITKETPLEELQDVASQNSQNSNENTTDESKEIKLKEKENETSHTITIEEVSKENTTPFFANRLFSLRILVIVVLLAGALLYLLFSLTTKYQPSPIAGTSPGYVRAALEFQEIENINVDPCDDFYEFVCGNYSAAHPIPEDKTNIDYMYNLEYESERSMKNLLESSEKSNSTAVEKMKSLYRACLNEETFTHIAPHTAFSKLMKIGAFPMLEGHSHFNSALFSLQNMKQQIYFENLPDDENRVFKFDIIRNPKDQKEVVFSFDQPKLIMESLDYYTQPEKFKIERAAYKKMLTRMLKEYATDVGLPENSDLESDLDDIFTFEGQLAKVMKTNAERRDITKDLIVMPFDVFSLQFKSQSGFDFEKFVNSTFYSNWDPELNHPTHVLLWDSHFPTNLNEVLQNSDPKTVTNYMMLSVLYKFKPFAGQKYKDVIFELEKELSGVTQQQPRWKFCSKFVESMTDAHGALYARRYFNQSSLPSLTKMVEKVRESFIDMLEDSRWMDKETKELANKKAAEMVPLLGFGEMALDDEKLDKYYGKLNFSETDNFIEMAEKLSQWKKEKHLDDLIDFNRKVFPVTSANANAWYYPEHNAMVFPAAILQSPFYDVDQPEAMNFGLIGAVIGHELTHGFDDEGKDYDDQGNLKNWWSEETMKQFKKRSQCIIDQYSSIEIPHHKMSINGKLTAGENIADNGGLKMAFTAYKKFINESGTADKILPGIDLSPAQLFFYGYAKSWCSAKREEKEKQDLLDNPHSPPKYRTNVVLQNSEDFAEAFKCKSGSKMNPKEKCRVW